MFLVEFDSFLYYYLNKVSQSDQPGIFSVRVHVRNQVCEYEKTYEVKGLNSIQASLELAKTISTVEAGHEILKVVHFGRRPLNNELENKQLHRRENSENPRVGGGKRGRGKASRDFTDIGVSVRGGL